MPKNRVIDAMWDDSPIDVSTEVNFIWSIANKLRGPYRSDKYKDVIIPMTIIRRFECALAPTKSAVVAKYKENPNFPAKAMQRISGFQFYNTSEFDLAELVNDADHIAANFKSYLQGFSANVLEILMSKERGLNFGEEIDKMDKNNRLLSVVKAFSELDLNPRTIDNVKMGYIFEELIRKFSENADAGDHYTGRDIVKLMVNILLAEGCEDIFDDGKVITILDQACGTGGMLSTGYNFIKRYNPSADVRLFGQENSPESYAMCLAEMLIKGQNAENICYQDTMIADRFKGLKMRFVLENPPFGAAWGGKDAAEGVEDAVNAEHKKGFDGRWGAGLPGAGDMQMLFLQSAIDKMDDSFGRAAIIENGSPLFNGGTASGESQIRRWLLESDLVEAIIALPTELFYNTEIATYIWILSKNKRSARRGKIQLIDASNICHKLRKALGKKKNEISPEDRIAITKLYADFEESDLSRIFRNEDFIYKEYSIMQPLQRSYAITEDRIQHMLQSGSLSSVYNEAKVNELQDAEELSSKEQKKLDDFIKSKPLYDSILEALYAAVSPERYMSEKSFKPVLAAALATVTSDKKLITKIAYGLSVMDKEAEIQRDKKGNIVYDKDSKDTELIGYEEDIDEYMRREVLPYVPDAKAFFEENMGAKKPVIKTGAEIPFTRTFYRYQTPTASEDLEHRFIELEEEVTGIISELFGQRR
jgi:type I restriction enzyme M protein